MAIHKKVVLLLLACFELVKSVNVSQLSHLSAFSPVLEEITFEEYLELYVKTEERQLLVTATEEYKDPGCTIKVNGDLGQPQPVYLRNGELLEPFGNSGTIKLEQNEEVTVNCPGLGRHLEHPLSVRTNIQSASVRCVRDNLVDGKWRGRRTEFREITCNSHPLHHAAKTERKCAGGRVIIEIGFVINNVNHVVYESCFDENTLEVVYVKYNQTPQHGIFQSGVTRPGWAAGTFFPGINVNSHYTQVTQKQHIAQLIGQNMTDKYITSSQFLSRGHLAAKSDFIFATGQRASFYFINCAPQWTLFNNGNWNFLEQNLRHHIAGLGYNTTIFTGTYGVTQLRDEDNVLRDIYLYTDDNNNGQIPVPLYFYKVVYDNASRKGTAFVSINNPYYTLDEAIDLMFCTDLCRNERYNWIGWKPDDMRIGYSFCCDVNDFNATVKHLPNFSVTGLLF